MSTAIIFGLCGAALVGLGLYGAILNPEPLRKILGVNLVATGVFLVFGSIARRGAAAGFAGDPVPQALIVTGIVVACAGTAVAIALLVKLRETGGSVLLDANRAVVPDRDG